MLAARVLFLALVFPVGTSVGSALVIEVTGIGSGTIAANVGERFNLLSQYLLEII